MKQKYKQVSKLYPFLEKDIMDFLSLNQVKPNGSATQLWPIIFSQTSCLRGPAILLKKIHPSDCNADTYVKELKLPTS